MKRIAPYLLVAGLFTAGLYALHHLLAPVDLRDVMNQVRATPASSLLLAVLATAGGYAVLIGYDWSGLQYIGRRLPARVVVLGGFLGYAFGNTIGLNALTGGTFRYRIYAALGLDAYDVAAMMAFAALSFGTGTLIVALAALAIHPGALQAFAAYDPALVRLAAATGLAVIGLTLGVIAVRRGRLRLGRFTIAAPSASLMAVQLILSVADICLAASALYVLLPASDLSFGTFLVIFAVAVKAGLLSHVPGGIGVFESVIIAALSGSVPLDQAAAALLLYRLIYYLGPFCIAVVVLSVYEARMLAARAGIDIGRAGRQLQPLFRTVSAVVPIAMAAMVFGSGVWMLVSSLIPATSEAADALELALPLAVVEAGALLSSSIGALLIIISHGLLRRAEAAYWLALVALAAGSVAALAHGVDYDRALVMAASALILLPCRHEFYRATRLTRAGTGPEWAVLVAATMTAGGFVIFFAQKSAPYANELWWQFAADESAPRAMRAGLLASLALLAGLLILSMRPPRMRPELPDATALDLAAQIIARQADPNANLALTGDKALLFDHIADGLLMYAVQGRSWVALGDPVGDRESVRRLAWALADAADLANGRPIFYQVSERHLPLWLEMGLALHKLGEEASVPLAGFGLEGGSRKSLRGAHNRAVREGLGFALVQPPHPPALIDELRGISEAWLAEKHTREKRFSVGRFDPAYLARFPLALVRAGGAPVAFANVLTTGLKEEATIDLMRHRPDAAPGVMEFLFVELMLELKAAGYRNFSLGMAPLAGFETGRAADLWSRFGLLLYRHGSHFYNFEGLRRFKEKFDPEWRPRYLAAPAGLSPLVPLADVAVLIAGGLRGVVAR